MDTYLEDREGWAWVLQVVLPKDFGKMFPLPWPQRLCQMKMIRAWAKSLCDSKVTSPVSPSLPALPQRMVQSPALDLG